jgi:hypothetical protein
MRFAKTAHLLDFSARRLAAPVSNVKADARSVADAIAEQVDRLNRDSEGALARLAAMEEVLRHHAESVQAASQDARSQVDGLIEDLRRERAALGDLSDHLRTEAEKITDTIDRQTEIISKASDVAAKQSVDGEKLLQGSAKGMTEAAAAAQKAAEKAALSIDEQLRDMQALVTALEERGGRLEDVARIHSDNVKIVQQTAHDLNLAADAGANSMKSASDAAVEQARKIAEVIKHETDLTVSRAGEEIDRLRRAAQAAREAAENAGLALEANADAVIERVRAANAAILGDDAAARRIDRERRAREREARSRERRRAPDRPSRGPRAERMTQPAEDDWLEEPPRRRAEEGRRENGAILLDADAPPPAAPTENGGRKRSARYDVPPPSSRFDDIARRKRDEGTGERHSFEDDGFDDFDEAPDLRGDRDDFDAPDADQADDGEWRWRDLLRNVDDGSGDGPLAGDAVVSGLRRAGIDPARALDPDMTARVARARRRAGMGEARALVVDGALSDVRRTSAALAADPTLRGRAEQFVGEHAVLIRRAIDENDAGLLSSLLDSDAGRAYLLVDAALADG